MISLKYLCDAYFTLFNQKKIDKLGELFSDDIILKDWNIYSEGKTEVLNSISEIYKNVENIEVISLGNYYEENLTVCCEISIKINKTDMINVVDIITFDNYGKIKKINAYKQ